MATEEQLQIVMNALADAIPCPSCGVRVRFGDLECPRCGEDIYDDLKAWAEQLIDEVYAVG